MQVCSRHGSAPGTGSCDSNFEKFHDYAAKVEAQLKENGIRALLTSVPKKMGYKIREARLARSSIHALLAPKRKKKARFP